jgi:hypothetical protein
MSTRNNVLPFPKRLIVSHFIAHYQIVVCHQTAPSQLTAIYLQTAHTHLEAQCLQTVTYCLKVLYCLMATCYLTVLCCQQAICAQLALYYQVAVYNLVATCEPRMDAPYAFAGPTPFRTPTPPPKTHSSRFCGGGELRKLPGPVW